MAACCTLYSCKVHYHALAYALLTATLLMKGTCRAFKAAAQTVGVGGMPSAGPQTRNSETTSL